MTLADGPVVTPALLIVLTGLEADRERHGAEWCRKHGVGIRRRLLGTPSPANMTEIAVARSPLLGTFLDAQREAQEFLSAMCQRCAHSCPLAGEIIARTPRPAE